MENISLFMLVLKKLRSQRVKFKVGKKQTWG